MKGIYSFCFEKDKPTWCHNSIPLIYSHGTLRSNVTVQSYYWNNGFLKYYSTNQIPNFFLAFPTFSIISFAIYDYFKYDKIRFLTLGFKKGINNRTKGYFSDKTLPFIYLNLAILFVVTFFMHVQVKFHDNSKVIVRFCTSSPIIYWYLANILSSNDNNRRSIARWYIGYSVIYGTIAIALFANFLPPA
jgi:phosphatidylinositol glycan class V